jgi:hypothetical protein
MLFDRIPQAASRRHRAAQSSGSATVLKSVPFMSVISATGCDGAQTCGAARSARPRAASRRMLQLRLYVQWLRTLVASGRSVSGADQQVAGRCIQRYSCDTRSPPMPRVARPSAPTSDPAAPRAVSLTSIPSSSTRWLLLIHQIPPKPDYLRVKISRRLQRVGSVPIKNSVYVLPPTTEAYEDFQWIVLEIAEGGGDAFISEASLVGEGLTDEDVRARFDAARGEEYREILADARALLKAMGTAKRPAATPRGPRAKPGGQRGRAADTPNVQHELAKLRRRYEAVNAIDFFGATEGATVAATISQIQQRLQRQRADQRASASARQVHGATWVTRRDVHVDRIASAWLIRRFIDRRPRFRFVDPKRHTHVEGELRFDMFEAEYTHVGDACTFETLAGAFIRNDAALQEIAEIVHDVDCKDAKFRRDEAAGIARMIAGIVHLCERDEDRLERGGMLFDDLYAAFGGTATS